MIHTALQINPADLIPKGDPAARRKRLFSPPARPVARVEEKPVLTLVRKEKEAPAPRVWREQHDSHVMAYIEWKGNEPLGFLKMRCRELGLESDRMIGYARKADEVHSRGLLIVEVKLRYPEMSLHAIGKLFGGRDHTTILHFLHKHGIRQAPRPRTAPLYRDTVKEMFFAGALFTDIAAAINRSTATVSNIVKENGWTRPKLSLEGQSDKIRSMFMDGKTLREIGPAVGFSHVHVGAFIKRMGWTR